jgi:hypothetical protein
LIVVCFTVNENFKMIRPVSLLLLGKLTVLLALPAPAFAGDSTSTAVLATAASVPVASEANTQALADRAALESRIATLENSADATGPALSEAYLSLGIALRALKQPDEALSAFDKAQQPIRTSGGLFDLQQLPILQEKLATLLTLQYWEEVDATSHLIYYTTSKKLPAGAKQRYEALLQLARWKFKAGSEGLLPVTREADFEAAKLYSREIKAMAAVAPYEGKNLQLGQLNLELAAVEYQLTNNIYRRSLASYQDTQQRTTSRLECQTFRFPNGAVSQTCTNVDTPNLDYYADAGNRKNLDLNVHIDSMHAALIEALALLQNDPVASPERDALLKQLYELTLKYNAFIDEAR